MVATLPLRPSSSGRLWRQANAPIRWVRVNTRSVMRQLFALSTFLRSVVSSFPLLHLLSFCLEWFCEFPFFKYPRALEALRLNARSVRRLLAFNLSHACSS